MRYFEEAEELLTLFEIDVEKPAAQDFCCLADLYALMVNYEQYGVTMSDLAALLMKQRRLSPKVFWSRMKRTIGPLLEADAETLRALGVPVGYAKDDHQRTCPELAAMVGSAAADAIKHDSEAAEIAAKIARTLGKAK